MSNGMHYKDYVGSVEFSEEDQVFHGKLIGISDLVLYEGDSVTSLVKNFHEAVDDYLESCERNGRAPDKPYKGSFNVRIPAELHRKAALKASENGMTLNALVEEAIRSSL